MGLTPRSGPLFDLVCEGGDGALLVIARAKRRRQRAAARGRFEAVAFLDHFIIFSVRRHIAHWSRVDSKMKNRPA